MIQNSPELAQDTNTLKVGDVVQHHYDIKRGFTTLGLVQEVDKSSVRVIWASQSAQQLPTEFSWYKYWTLKKIS
jgi:hypothetical protein